MKHFDFLSYLRHTVSGALGAKDLILPSGKVRSRPHCLHIEINNYCNIRCIHCLRQAEDAEINSGRWTPEMFEKILPWIKWASFVGIAGLGEPFVEKNLPEFLQRIVGAGACPSVTTNGTLLRPDVIHEIAGLGPMLINFSIDGATPETFNRIREGADFDKVVQNMLALREARERLGSKYPAVQICWVWLKSNLNEVEQLAALAEQIGAVMVRTQPLFFKTPESIRHEAVTDAEVAEAGERLRKALNPSIALINSPLNTSLPPDPASQNGRNGTGPKFFCPNIWNTMQISPAGDVRVCCMGTFPELGNIMEKSLDEIWNGPEMIGLRLALLHGDLPEDCRKCYILRRYDMRSALDVLKTYRFSLDPRQHLH